LKEKLSKFPILRRPNSSKSSFYTLTVVLLVIGVIFGQLDEKDKEYVIAYAS
jgi:hypothetical protein